MPLTLHDLLARGMHVEWFEAVAIVQALCARLLHAPPPAGVHVPELHGIVITAEGAIDVTGEGPADQSPVFRVGQVLSVLVAHQQMPVPLRLVALTAVSPSPPYASIGDLSSALDYYERPDRAGVVRAVYERYQALPPAAEGTTPVEEIAAVPAPAPDVRTPSRWRRHRRLVATGATLAVLAGAAASFPLLRARVPWVDASSRGVVRLAGEATASVAAAVSSGVDSVRGRLGGTSSTAPPAEPPTPEPAPPASPARPTARALLPAGRGWVSPNLSPGYVPSAAPMAPPGGISGAALLVEPPFPLAPVVEAGDWTIYSAADLDVVPPATVHPKMPTDPPAGVRPEALPLVELVISANGEVESVKLRTSVPDVRTSMMISAVKAWRFQPATRNGRPVRYRYLVRLTGQ